MQIVSRRPDYIPASPSSFIIGSALPWRTFDIGWWHPKAVLAFDPLNARYMRGGADVALTAQVSTVRSSPHLLTSPAGLLQSFGVNALAAIKDVGAYIGGQFLNKLWPSDFSSAWTLSELGSPGSGGSLTLSQIDGPDGAALSGAKIMRAANAVDTNRTVYYRQATSPTSGATAWVAVNVKKGNTRYVNFGIYDGLQQYCTFDFDTETFVNSGMSSPGFQRLANGWYRIWAKRVLAAAVCSFHIGPTSTSAAAMLAAPGQYIYVHGACVNEGTFAVPYFPSLAAPTTQMASAVSAVASGSDPFAGFSGNGLSFGLSALAAVKLSHVGDGTIRPLMEISDGSTSNRLCLYIDTDDKPVASVISSGSTLASVKLASALTAARVVLAANYDPANGLYLIRKTGLEEASTSLSGMPSGLSKLAIGSNASSSYFNDLVEQLQITRRLTRSEASAWAQAA